MEGQAKKTLTLIEVLIALILIGIGLAAAAGVLTAGRYFLKRTENRARAMSLAYQHKESLMAKSYQGLVLGTDSGSVQLGGEGTDFHWATRVAQKYENDIPWKKVDIEVKYLETDIRGAETGKTNRVYLTTLVPYPYVHVESRVIQEHCCTVGNNQTTINGLSIPIDYPVEKTIVVAYNIILGYGHTENVEGGDLILTQTYLDGVAKSVETGTPILTQPVINNIADIGAVSPGEHTIEVRWEKHRPRGGAGGVGGDIYVREAEIVIIAYEN